VGALQIKTCQRKMECRETLLKWLLLSIVSLGICPLDSAAQQATDDAPQPENQGGEVGNTSTTAQPQFASPAPATANQPLAFPSAGNSNVNQNTNNQKQTGRTSKDRLFFTLPNFLTVEDASQAQPLTAKQKFSLTARSSFDYSQFFWSAAVAGVSQAENREPGYGQGAAGYGKRYGSHLADTTIENFATGAVFPSLLHQDPRYFQMGKGSFWRRSGYAVSRIAVTRTDSGRRQANYSEILGSAVASAISTYSYYPRGDRNLANVLSLWGSQMTFDTLGFLMKEFWPDLRRKLRRPKTAQSP
jgi:hypothetical protein